MSIKKEFEAVVEKAKRLKYPDDWLLLSAFISTKLASGKLVLLGGFAVGVYTRGQYITGDVDALCPTSVELKNKLRKLGFEQVGRHLAYPDLNYMIEIPTGWIGRRKVLPLRIAEYEINLISPEDLIVDRLSAYKFWDSQTDFTQAAMVFAAQRERIDNDYLRMRAREEDVMDAYKKLITELRKIK